ncbi:uncharacterized protein TRIVIDRAFT_69582 [Trichoderma virens Gv29-8]|uniref:Uncharacterized protein n=1 Tax=Hypocrea virens (strain Gv29-8 / FGSC 10586) TaxID=413071 RepID=G9MGM0_HYPVG|nr:uncharacterized protein TRIVIDRAFT_69582 [Trichoderma virens Gv29-8]EHK26667.1 hypothetical protein TRIVIDRAFT_69582 [Trichoderma virens Gv29-8]UKZ46841.1 hypothetical protein TrVGV298_001052 [Trichoderma virens]UKZ73422.1 hypothetical protein TrVFT333_001069 [Trichoderma virens FT-333]
MLFLALLAPLLQLAAAAPTLDVAEGSSNELLKRGDGSGIHLVNCDGFGGEGTIVPPSSHVVYCANDSNCNFSPSGDNICTMGVNFWFTWEGHAQACTFSTGAKFSWFIDSNAQSQANFAHVGDGGNQFRAYAGYKDDKHTMFFRGSGQCHSIYYFI